MLKSFNLVVTFLLSFAFLVIGILFFAQSKKHEKVRLLLQNYDQKSINEFWGNPKSKLITIVSKISPKSKTYDTDEYQKLVFYYQKDQQTKSNRPQGWKTVNSSTKLINNGFELDIDDKKVIVDSIGLDLAYLKKSFKKLDSNGNYLKRRVSSKISLNDKVIIIGQIRQRVDEYIITDSNLYKSLFNSFYDSTPYIISTLNFEEIMRLAKKQSQSTYYSALAMFAFSLGLIFLGLKKIN